MLKGAAESIAPSLTKLFNISINAAQFPKCWKNSSVVPIPKNPNNTVPSNYRPISLLPIVSKILERHFHMLISDQLQEHYLISSVQWGFQPGKSTFTALLYTVEILESGNQIYAVFLDLRKAFDSVPHQPLLEKLATTGLDDHLLRWIHRYLTEHNLL